MANLFGLSGDHPPSPFDLSVNNFSIPLGGKIIQTSLNSVNIFDQEKFEQEGKLQQSVGLTFTLPELMMLIDLNTLVIRNPY